MIDALLSHDGIRAARAYIERSDETTLARQATLSAIPAPTGAEDVRGARVAEMFAEVGLQDVGIDDVGNVRAWFGGAQHAAPLHDGCVVLSAHLDTVFGPEFDVAVSRRGPRLEGPGIADNARGLAALVTLAEAFVQARIATRRPVLLAATVGEEGSGDLRGVRYLLDTD
ncbi:MAG TPA: M20/M25/M40 family metallo-hydrolase, partial [Candidatus Krumholzibacteria bacterium]|nr:M20/M25/M40 family metallo-hydrolase [Candidatus Krumholzibacteria bacterium]